LRLEKIQNFLVTEGIKADPRGRKAVQEQLSRAKSLFRKLPAKEKQFFDQELLTNPYGDTRLLNGDGQLEVRRILVGIDIDVGEILLADQLKQRGEPVDLVISHHPKGKGLASLCDVMSLQTDMLKQVGIEEKIADELMKKRIDKVTRSLHSGNHSRVVDAARLLDVPLMCCHTAGDNHVVQYLNRLIKSQRPATLQRVVDLLMKEPEYRQAAEEKRGPRILNGDAKDKAGKIYVDMTGGTEGSQEIFARLSQIGISTLLCMHLSEGHLTKVKSEFMNVINAGHMASDSLGMNLLLDKLEKKEKFEILDVSGFRRYRR